MTRLDSGKLWQVRRILTSKWEAGLRVRVPFLQLQGLNGPWRHEKVQGVASPEYFRAEL